MNEKPSVTQIVALMIYLTFSLFIWFPIGMMMALVNPQLAIVIFLMYFVKEVSGLFLGIKK